MLVMKLKVCNKCKRAKHLFEFYRQPSCKDGLRGQCKKCDYEVNKIWVQKNRDKVNATSRRYRKNNKKKWLEIQRNSNLKRDYGITIEQYDEWYIKQGGRCAICGKHQSNFKKRFAVDHCHITGEVRGLLCHHCNTALGNFFDSINLVENALKYLKGRENALFRAKIYEMPAN